MEKYKEAYCVRNWGLHIFDCVTRGKDTGEILNYGSWGWVIRKLGWIGDFRGLKTENRQVVCKWILRIWKNISKSKVQNLVKINMEAILPLEINLG